jgi:hypothetical protein
MSIERSADRQVPLASPFGRQVRDRGTLRGLGLSAAVHLGLLALVLWGQHRMMEAGLMPGLGPGKAGGGGGGSRVFAVLAIPAARAALPPAPALTVPSLQALTVPVEQPAEEVPVQMSAEELAALIRATAPGSGGGQGSGAGPGTGPGTGGGSGGGAGGGSGGDSGGAGGNVFAPQLQGMILPPPDRPSSVRGVTFRVRIEVSARGEVLDVSIDPAIRDRHYGDEFLDRLRHYRFTPAYTRDGRAAPGVFEIRITL